MKNSYFLDNNAIKSHLEKLKSEKTLPILDFKNLLISTYHLLQKGIDNEDNYNLCLSVICHASEYLPTDEMLRELLLECISASRVFLYRDMLESKFPELEQNKSSIYNEIAREFYTLDSNVTLTKEQKELFTFFQKNKRIIVSAPTSFGKSRIIQEIINYNDYSNIAIILPTIALLSETFIRFRKDNNISGKYNLVNSLKQPLKDHYNILIFTPEKMDLFLDENQKFLINFFVMDEIYKIQDDGDRSKVFSNVLYRLSKTKSDFYLIGPYFNKFSPLFLEKTNSKFKKFTGEIVQKDYFDLTYEKVKSKVTLGEIEITNSSRKTNLKNILKQSKEQTLVYVGYKQSVESTAKTIAKNSDSIQNVGELIEYLENNFHKDWSLVTCLKKGVAFHHAGIPKFIQVEIVDAFNNRSNELHTIVCSPTLVEGVNTSAKQVILYDNKKGYDIKKRKEISLTDFDVKNINGRAGRFYQHFIGRSIALVKLPKREEDIVIDFSIYDNDLESEELLQVNIEDLNSQNLQNRQKIESDLQELNIPLSIIQQNKFIPLGNQLKLIEHLRKEWNFDSWKFNSPPTSDQFNEIFNRIFDYLFDDNDKNNKSFKFGQIKFHSKGYIYHDLTLKELIDQQEGKQVDTKIRRALKLITEYFEFKLPKYLSVFQNLYNFVCREKEMFDITLNLDWVIMKLEYGVTEPHEIALKEIGLPLIIVRAISEKFKGCNDINSVRERFKNDANIINNLHPYEKKIFEKHI